MLYLSGTVYSIFSLHGHTRACAAGDKQQTLKKRSRTNITTKPVCFFMDDFGISQFRTMFPACRTSIFNVAAAFLTEKVLEMTCGCSEPLHTGIGASNRSSACQQHHIKFIEKFPNICSLYRIRKCSFFIPSLGKRKQNEPVPDSL